MSAGLNDNELISSVLRGNQQAFSVLVQRYQSFVFTLVIRMVTNREEAEELAQDVFIKAYKYLTDFRGDAKFSTWLYTIAHNTCLSHLRKKKQNLYSLDDEKVFAAADNQLNGASMNPVEQKSRKLMVNEAIGRLGPDDNAVLTLFYIQEQTLEEIATVLGVEVNAAKVRLHRARTRLKEKMMVHYAQEIKDLN